MGGALEGGDDDIAAAVAADAAPVADSGGRRAASGGGGPVGAATAVACGERGWAAVVAALRVPSGWSRDDLADVAVVDAALDNLVAAAAPVAAPSGGEAAVGTPADG